MAVYIIKKCYFGTEKKPIKILTTVIITEKNPGAILIRYIKRATNIIRLNREAGLSFHIK
jgi:hypothetical protein